MRIQKYILFISFSKSKEEAALKKTLTLLDQIPLLGTYSNSVDPVQMPQYAASDQGLPDFLTGISTQNTIKVKIFIRNP